LSDDLCEDDYERELIDINEEFGNTINDINYRENAISEMVASLETRERKILALYFGLDGDKEHTLNEIGCELNLSGERVRQIMDKAIVKLKCGALMNDELMAMVEMN
jgi:RNA polymerase primary sigma factor